MTTHAQWVELDQTWRGFVVPPHQSGPAPAVVVMMDAFGVGAGVRALCQELAGRGYLAVAPDLYHGQVYGPEARARGLDALRALRDDTAMAAVGAALGWLERAPGAAPGAVAIWGICMGGRLAFLAHSVYAQRLAGAVCFYGAGIAAEHDPYGRVPLLDRIAAMRGPLWLAYGAEDSSITACEHGRIAQALSEAKRRYTLTVFPGVGHAFLNADRPGFDGGARLGACLGLPGGDLPARVSRRFWTPRERCQRPPLTGALEAGTLGVSCVTQVADPAIL